MSPPGLRKRIRDDVVCVVVAIVEWLDGWNVPFTRIECRSVSRMNCGTCQVRGRRSIAKEVGCVSRRLVQLAGDLVPGLVRNVNRSSTQ